MRIALFPLRTVLFPEGLLSLKIFEARYVDMIGRVMREDSGFGVVLIREGAEVGGIGEVASVGTFARVADFDRLPNGLLGIVARGERRFRLVGREQQPDGLWLGDVEWLEDAPERLAAGEFPELTAALGRALASLGDQYPAGVAQLAQAAWVAGHLGQLLPVPTELRQRILEMDGARQRLQAIEELRRGG